MTMQRARRSDFGNGGSRQDADERLANQLGWFSVGLGLTEVVAPGKLAQFIGVPDQSRNRKMLRAYGMREIAAGVGILTQQRPAGWMWTRVAGDLMDLGSLATAMASSRSNKTRLAAATTAVLGVTALDVYCGQKLATKTPGTGTTRDDDIRVTETIIVGRPAEEVYRYWRDFENMAKFMKHLDSVQVTGDRRSHWKAKAPGGRTVEWDAEIVEDQPNSLISWRSLPGADVDNSGTVRFERAPGGRGTLVRVEMEYNPPGGRIGSVVAQFFREEPAQQISEDLHALKQILETGEIAKSDASIYPGMHPAQPPAQVPDLVSA